MGGEGPAIQFDPSGVSVWSARTGLPSLSDAEREEAYGRAKSFFLRKMEEVVASTEWKSTGLVDIDGVPTLFHLAKIARAYELHFALPESFNSFLDPTRTEMWRKMLVDDCIFRAKRLDRNSYTLFLESLAPISDIFYLLQVLAPGMFLIWRMDEIDEIGADETSRALPAPDWIEDNRALLEEILGNTDKVEKVLDGAQKKTIAFYEKLSPYSWNEYEDLLQPSYADFYDNGHETD